MADRPNLEDVENFRQAILRVRKWWTSGPPPTGLFAEVWAAARFDLEEPRDNKANLPYDARDRAGRKVGIKARGETPYTKRTGKGLNYFAFRQPELSECDVFYLIAFDDKLVAKMCLKAPIRVVKNHVEGGRGRRLTFTASNFERFLGQAEVEGELPGSKDPAQWRKFGLGLDSS